MKFFKILLLVLATLFIGVPAHADESNTTTCNAKAGCGHTPAPGVGTGVSSCWITFVAPQGATGMKLQLFDGQDDGILRNAKGEVALRGSESDTRVSVDCGDMPRGVKLANCVFLPPNPDGSAHVRNGVAAGGNYKTFLRYTHHLRGVDVQL